MTLKDVLILFNKNKLVSIVYKNFSNGAYKIEELLKRNDELLLKIVPENGIEIYVEKAEEVVAEDSELRDEFFQNIKDKEIAYAIIEVYDSVTSETK